MAQNVVLAKVEMAFVPAEVVTTVHVNRADFFFPVQVQEWK